MKTLLGAMLVASLSAAGLLEVAVTARQRSVVPGIYTSAQANRGAVLYCDSCESCHAPDLAGGKVVPEMVGPTFIARWSGRMVGRLYERVLESMPEDDLSSVSRQEKADIVAFILRANGFPAGDDELADRNEILDQFLFEAVTP